MSRAYHLVAHRYCPLTRQWVALKTEPQRTLADALRAARALEASGASVEIERDGRWLSRLTNQWESP